MPTSLSRISKVNLKFYRVTVHQRAPYHDGGRVGRRCSCTHGGYCTRRATRDPVPCAPSRVRIALAATHYIHHVELASDKRQHSCSTASAQLQHSFITAAAQLQHSCNTAAAQLQHSCNTAAAQLQHSCRWSSPAKPCQGAPSRNVTVRLRPLGLEGACRTSRGVRCACCGCAQFHTPQ